MQELATLPASASADFLPLNGVDHVEFYVSNAKQAAYFYRSAFGMAWIGYAGPETGTRDRVSYVLEQNEIRFVLTTPLDPDSVMAGYVFRHGDGVRDIALSVDDAAAAYRETIKRGARGVEPPAMLHDAFGQIRLASIATYGDTIHTFVERNNYRGCFLPGFVDVPGPDGIAGGVGLLRVDHIVGNVGSGEMDTWVRFYERVMGFSLYQTFDDSDISTEYSSLMSKVVANGSGRIKFPINEPAKGRKKSQIEEYLESYRGPGVQHIALNTSDMITTVRSLQERGVQFLKTPSNYYDTVLDRVGHIAEDVKELAELGILVDHDDEGYLLQIFSKPIVNRPTVFFEVIERKGARGFGEGNFKALFEALD